MTTNFFDAVMLSTCEYYGVKPNDLKRKHAARHPDAKKIMLARGCFIGLLSTLEISKAAACRHIGISRQLGFQSLAYFKANKGDIDTEALLSTIQKRLADDFGG